MTDWKKDKKLFLKLIEFVRDNSEKSVNARKKYALAGIVLTYEKVWFTGDWDLDKFKVRGRDWEIEIALHNKWGMNMPTGSGLSSPVPCVSFEGRQRGLVGLSVSNRGSMNRDLALLRMFGVEELFSGA